MSKIEITQPMLAFDLETTGVDAWNDLIVTANTTRLRADGTTDSKDWLINPGVEIPEAAANVHGITTEEAKANGRDPQVAIAEIIAELNEASSRGVPIVGFNVSYDLSLLTMEARRHGLTEPTAFPVLDGFVMDKKVSWRKGKRNLGAVCEYYGIELENAHSADADAIASAYVVQNLLDTYKSLQIPLKELHARQVTWRREQASSLEKYLRKVKNDPALVVEKSWPTYMDEGAPAA